MSGNAPATSGQGEAVTDPETTKTRGRTRYCKKCKFTCTDAREFTAHQSTHTDTSDNQKDVSTEKPIQATASTNSASARRVLRPKRNSKGSVSEILGASTETETTVASEMEPTKDVTGEAAAAEDIKSSEAAESNGTEVPSLNKDMNGSEDEASLKVQEKSNEERMEDDEEGGDEPDAMTTTSQGDKINNLHNNNVSDKTGKLPNGVTENFSGEEDMDEEGRLVIDDDEVPALIQDDSPGHFNRRRYSCKECGTVIHSGKDYTRHLRDEHNMDTSNFMECDRCTYVSINKHRYDVHRKYLHGIVEEGCKSAIMADYNMYKASQAKINKHDNFLNVRFPDAPDSSKREPMYVDDNGVDDYVDGADTPSMDKMSSSVPLTITTDNIDQVLDEDKKKKKKTRQEVDPGKYFEAVDSSGTKYACSQCGNIYKWRKSLNKHWKEKHSADPLVEVASPPGMLELLKSGKYTQLGARRIYDNNFLSTIKTNKNDDHHHASTSSPSHFAQSPSPPNFLTTSQTLMASASRLASSVASVMPKVIGPYVVNSAQPVFPGMPMTLPHLSLHNGYDSPEEGALDLTRDSKPGSSRNSPYTAINHQDLNSSFDQDQPLDFSRKKGERSGVEVKTERLWEEMSSMKPAHTVNRHIEKVHRCSKCDFTSTSEVDFANHTSSHLNKRVVRCNECHLQLPSMDELNNHFYKHHYKKLAEYKEAIKKIPHGLQQTYHLLNMDLQDIGELGNQDLGSGDGKSLKCKKCNFEAKWPAELQKHAVSHSEERPYICMVCGSTYKWKWDLVKHFTKSHPNLPNPYRRNDKRDTPDGSSEDEDMEDEPEPKKARLAASNDMMNGNMYNRDDSISVEGIIAATQAGQRLVSSQPNILDDEPNMDRNMAFLNAFPFPVNSEMAQVQAAQIAQVAQAHQEMLDRRNKAQRALQDSIRTKHNGIGKKSSNRETNSASPSSSGSKSEELPYKCTMCNYHARWPSEVTQHMKNHSDSKPYLCPRCEYRSKWKWDVVKHLKRCGGGGINDVIDTTKSKKREMSVSNGPPNAIVSQQGKIKKTTPQPPLSYIVPSIDEHGQQSAVVVRPSTSATSSGDDMSRPGSNASTMDLSSSSNNNDLSAMDNNFNNNYAAYSSGLPFTSLSSSSNITFPSSVSSSFHKRSPAHSPALAPSPSPASQTSSGSRQNSSGEVWNCPHCPFTTQSQAELKRHSGLHSDDKPFKCDVCQYSTRWACDLKKHRKSYNHFSKPNNSMKEKTQGRFKCFQCIVYFQSLQGLLEHRMAEHIGRDVNQGSPNPQTDQNEIDAARIKHPRKPIRQIQCPKCPFVCKSRQTMDKHMEEHEQLELSGLHCFYCSSQFLDKESLLDHITTHSAFNPKEWETFFMINEEDEPKDDAKSITENNNEIQMMNKEANQNGDQSDKKDSTKGKTPDSTEARIQQILSEASKQLPPSQTAQQQNKFKCEWCPAEFVNLTAVYKHASQAHPIQLKEQDVSMGTPGEANTPKSPTTQQPSSKKVYSGEPIDILKQQIAEKRNQQLAEKLNEMFPNSSKMQEAMGRKFEGDKGGKHYSCDKCNFSSASLETFRRHYELHGSKLTSQCWFCDYSVDRMNLLYQHMKISHTRKWKSLSQDPKYASQIQKMNLAFAGAGVYGNNNDSPPDTLSSVFDAGAMDLSSKPKSSDVAHDIMYITRQQYTWSGIPVNVIPFGNALNFVCPHCSYSDASIAKTCSHVMQSHRAMAKFTCRKCKFSDDNIHVMSDHCKTNHPVSERVVEVLDFKQLNFSELQMVQLSAMSKRLPQESVKSEPQIKDEKTLAARAMSCPFCPFRTLVTEHMKAHLSDHSKNAHYQCQVCDFSSDSPSVISDHVKVHDATYTLDSRSLTLAESNTSKKVKKESTEAPEPAGADPMEVNHNDREGSPKSKLSKRLRYRCAACPYYTTCRNNVVKHKRQHNNNKKYKCPKCSYGAARAVLLKNHLDSHDTPVEDDGQYHDIFVDPTSPGDSFKTDEIEDHESEEAEMEPEDDEDTNSDDLDEMDAKAIADLEAKDIMEAEEAHKASILLDEEPNSDHDSADKPVRRQKCPHCPFSSNSVYEFRKHQIFHGTQERYKCDRCSYSLDRLNLLSQHRKLHSDEPGYNPNPPASDLLNTSFILQQNNAEMAENKNANESVNAEENNGDTTESQFSCTYCPYKASQKKAFDIHCNSHGLRKRYICDFCDWSADRIGLLYQHRKVHEDEANFDASQEDKNFINHEFDDGASGEFEAKFMEIKNGDQQAKEGEAASASHSPPFKLTVVKKSYPCKLCPYKTNSKNSYSVHKSMHEADTEFSCTECSYAAPNSGLLQQHLQLHMMAGTVLSSPTVSQLPGQSSPSANQLSESGLPNNTEKDQRSSGQSESTANPELKCQRCPFTAASQNLLKEHVKGHATQDSFSCPYCDFSATSKQVMFSHIQIHFPGTKLEQDAMEKMLNDNSSDNQTSGTSAKPPKQSEAEAIKTKRVYVCQYCEREFEAKDLMIQHEKQHLVGSQ